MKLAGKTIAVLVEDLYQELEVWYPLYRLREEGATTLLVGTGSKSSYKSKLGYPATPDTSAEKLAPASVDAVVIPGGFAPDILRRHDSVNRLVREVFKRGAVVAGICHGGWVLVSAGILKGRRATCFFAIKDDLKNAGADYVDQEVVVDQNLITSRKPDDLPAFCRAIIEALQRR